MQQEHAIAKGPPKLNLADQLAKLQRMRAWGALTCEQQEQGAAELKSF